MNNIFAQNDHTARIELRLRESTSSLLRHVGNLKKIHLYAELLLLDKRILTLLVDFEEAKIDSIGSADENILGRTGGHHSDCLRIYQSALEGMEFSIGCFVYMSDFGMLNFGIADVLEIYLGSCPSSR